MLTRPSLKGFKDRKESLSIIVITLVLSGFISFLLITNYKSQKKVLKSAQNQLKHGMEKMAISSSYFFSERKNDFKNLSTCRELSTFFENKALGMSMEYGLRASLLAISRNFNQLLEERQLNNDKIYSRIVFIDPNGKLLIDTLSGNREQAHEREWKKLLNPETKYTDIIIAHQKDSSEIMISTPYFFKNSYKGQIVGWIHLETIYKNFIKSMEPSTKKLVFFVCDKGHLHLDKDKELNIDSSYISSLVKRKTDEPSILEAVNKDNQKEKMLALWIQVKDTPFFLMTILPFAQVFGHTGPWNLFLVMAVLSIVIISGTVILMRINAHNLVLRTRLEETAKRESEIERKNKVLNKEITVLKIMEMRLRNNEKYLKLLLDSIQSGIMLIDYETHKIIDINQAAIKMIDAPKKTLLGAQCHKNICPSEIGRCPITDLGQTVDTKECILIDSKANEIPIIKTASSITIKNQRCILESFTNISEYKKAEIALRENEERFRSLAEAAPFGLSIVKLDKTFEYLNPKFTEIFGYTLKDLPDKRTWFRKAYPNEEYRNNVINVWKKDLAQNQKNREVPFRAFTVRCKKGEDKQIRFRAVGLKDGKQILTYEDITLQEKMEQDLKESEGKYRNLLENIQDGFFSTERRNKICK
jgi:PAS domain S-box-containing protein